MGFSMQMDGLAEFAANVRKAAGAQLKADIRLAINAIGMEFLRTVQDEILACNAVVTRLMINSFGKGGPDNVWSESDGGLTLDVGSGVEYVRYVNDGHHKTPAGVAARFVPGKWGSHGFEYIPGHKGGMLLKAGWVEGKHFWEAALRHVEPIIDRYLNRVLDEWMAKYFG